MGRTERDPGLFAAGILLMVGRLVLISSFFFLESYFSFGVPRTPVRIFLFLPIGLLLVAGGYRLGAGNWAGVGQVPHQSAAYAGLIFIGLTAKYALASRPVHFYPEGFVALVSGLLIASWFLRAKSRAYREKPSHSKF